MTDLRVSKRDLALMTGICVALTGTAFGEGSELPDGSVTIPSTPFADTGDTSDNTNDADATCPYAGSTSPDVFYGYTADGDGALTVSLCESNYDTKTYILDANTFDIIGCNDDGCSDSNGNPFRSILSILVSTGDEVFIAVDGWSGDFGTYDLTVNLEAAPEPCLECPDGSIDEGEACADDGSVDTNGGCNATPTPIFDNVNCGDTVCGLAWALGGTRDTDWYILSHAEATDVTYSASVGFDAAMFYLGSNPTCDAVAVVASTFPLQCGSGSLCVGVDAGESWWFMGKVDFDLLPCGPVPPATNTYVANWECGVVCPPPPCPGLGDLDGNGFVEFADLLTVLANWGPCPG